MNATHIEIGTVIDLSSQYGAPARQVTVSFRMMGRTFKAQRFVRMDVGLEANDLFKTWHAFLLPQRNNRTGFELRCEVVSPERIDATLPGHGHS